MRDPLGAVRVVWYPVTRIAVVSVGVLIRAMTGNGQSLARNYA